MSRSPLAPALLLVAALAHPLPAQDPLRLRPGDALRVQVQDEPSWSGDFEIGEDGTVLLHPLGLVQVAGRPFAEVKEDLLRAYQRELVNTAVTITPLVRIAVLGEVQRPGLLPVDPTLSLADVVAAAGGITPLGDRNKIRLVRDGRALSARLDPESDTRSLSLRSGDELFVGRRSWWAQNTPVLLGALGSVTAAVIASILVR
ncbi:MAG: SLBB domain-containing protein [Gemmatimonadetes bacterium]|nr:SLBB domain-containing protein [Gemmatimonadota bacterium]